MQPKSHLKQLVNNTLSCLFSLSIGLLLTTAPAIAESQESWGQQFMKLYYGSERKPELLDSLLAETNRLAPSDSRQVMSLEFLEGQFSARDDWSKAAFIATRELELTTEKEFTTALLHERLGGYYKKLGKFDEATAAYKNALKGFEQARADAISIARTQANLAHIHLLSGRFAEAVTYFEQSVPILSSCKSRINMDCLLKQYAWALAATGKTDEANVIQKERTAQLHAN